MKEWADRVAKSATLAGGILTGFSTGALAQESSPSFTPNPSSLYTRSYIEEEINSDSTRWRIAAMAESSIYICITDNDPEVIDLDNDGKPEYISVVEADCGRILPTGEIEIYENTTRDVPSYNAEIIDINYFISRGESVPPIFETIEDSTVVYE